MADLMDPNVIDDMIRQTPGAVRVSCGGVDGWGHDAYVPDSFGDGRGVVGAVGSVVVASEKFPGIGIDRGSGEAFGVDERIRIGDFDWYISGVEPGESPGEVRLLLSNRESSG